MSSSFTPGNEVPAEHKVVLNVLLNCEETKSSRTKQVHFKSLPSSPLEIKKKIEEDFSIPSCIQTLHYQSMILKDSDQLQHTHFRSGDTFTVDYPIEAECEMAQNVIRWLKELFPLLKSMEECLLSPDKGDDAYNISLRIEHLIVDGDRDGITQALSVDLFFPWEDKKKQMNNFYFQQEGGLDLLMKVYGVLVSKKWGDFGIGKDFHVYMENKCSHAVCNNVPTFPLRRQIIQLGGLEMCITTLLREQLQGDECIFDAPVYSTLDFALVSLGNFSELPECQVPLAMRTDVIDQILMMACCSHYEVIVPLVSVNMIMCLAQSTGAHPYLVRTKVIEDLLKIHTLREKINNEQPPAKKEDPIAFKALQCYTCLTLAQIGLGSPDLYSSIPLHLQQQILDLMSTLVETVPPADIRRYEVEIRMVWRTFLPFMQLLYKSAKCIDEDTKCINSTEDLKHNLHINCCNVLLHGLENTLGRELHLEVLLKEGLLDYTMCLPAILPRECQRRARSLVNELCKHRQLQPPSLCTLAKAHIAKTFCGLQPVMEMNSIGEFVYKYFPAN